MNSGAVIQESLVQLGLQSEIAALKSIMAK